MSHLAEQTELEAKAVKSVLLHLENTILSALHKKGAGEFTLPGLFKVVSVKVPATKRRFGKNPFTGQEQAQAPGIAAAVAAHRHPPRAGRRDLHLRLCAQADWRRHQREAGLHAGHVHRGASHPRQMGVRSV